MMTDKELKDWCKTCSVEPPAMKFKCPECEHNPDKEQIIIDGVDVSGCCYAILPKNQCPAKIKPYAKETSCIACKEHNTKLNFCKNNPNCYFKQLARKTQEYNDLLEQHKELDDRVNRMIEEKYSLARECEELKKQLNTSEEWRIKAENLNEKQDLENTHYRKALEEIEEIVKQTCRKRCTNDCLGTRKHCGYGAIFNIINKAKGGEDEHN